MANSVLDGIRVVEFSTGAAIPDLCRILGAFGADVIHVESKDAFDYMRRLTLGGTLNQNPGFNDGNRNKRGIAVDLKTSRGREMVIELIKRSDIIAENHRADVMQRWGLDYQSVREIKPDIIYISSQGWGGGGPYSNYISYGTHGAAASGLQYLWNYLDIDHPAAIGLNHPDHIAGKIGLVALLAALDYRRRTGKGRYIDCSQIEVAAALVGDNYLDYTMHDRLQIPLGNRSPRAAPHGIYKCQGTVQHAEGLPAIEDRWLAISVFTEAEWQDFCQAIGNPPWTKDSKFASLLSRKENEDELDTFVEEWTGSLSPWEAMRILQQAGIAVAVVEDAEDHILRDPHLKARGFITEFKHPESGITLHINEAIRLSDTPARLSTPAPMLDQHTDEILHDLLDLSAKDIKQLREDGIIGI
jgi:crotonobetainyl-CoA:carnitine CoA-transferase CaiB-like acyl-CoA transferase